MEFRVREEEDGRHVSVLAPGGEIVAICTNRRAAEDVADAMQRGCEESLERAVAFMRLKHGAAIVEPR